MLLQSIKVTSPAAAPQNARRQQAVAAWAPRPAAARALQQHSRPQSSRQPFQQQRRRQDTLRWARAVAVRAQSSDDKDLHQQIEAAAAEAAEGLEGTSIYLVGMMGSGKSTVGRLLSQALQYCFFDTDSLIEQAAGKPVSQIFADEGEEAFRELETEVIRELSPFRNCVVATGGGLPTRAVNWGHLQGGISVWLNGPPQLLAHRVIGDGTDSRPLLAQEGEQQPSDAYQATVQRLTKLLEERREMYGQSDIMVSLEGSGPAADLGAPAALVTLRVLLAVADRIRRDAARREERKQFEIVEGELPSTMRVMPAAESDDPFLP